MTFTAEELRLLRASDKAEDGPGYRGRGRRSQPPPMPRPTVTVRESIARLSSEDKRWMIEQGYLTTKDTP